MLSHEQNERLTRIGPATPMGTLMRRYWVPAAVSEELSSPGGAPVRVRLLGEQLVAFRDPAGVVGLVKEHCPHRGASLVYARNEEGGLRCLYHGWKMDAQGQVVETPAEPKGSSFARKLCHVAYPVREAGGVVWTYMGPAELEPPFPNYPWLGLPKDRLLVVKLYQETNFLQGVEGDLDPAHPNYLHRDFRLDDKASWAGAGWKSIADLMHDGAPKIECERTPYLMRVGAIRATSSAGSNYVRTTEWVAPFYAYIATGPGESRLFKAWHPIDDDRCFTFYIHYHPDTQLDKDAIHANWGHRTVPPHFASDGTLANLHLQNRSMMATNFSGMVGAAQQDRAVQESMGPIYDRTNEHLGTSDKAVVFYRRLLLRLLRDMEEGRPLPAHDPSLDFDQRSASCRIPAEWPWQEARRYQEEQELLEPKQASG
jgi:phenylpropionate dioxygenase-like ring-hydroxylating dioxygenase large terminal subunit